MMDDPREWGPRQEKPDPGQVGIPLVLMSGRVIRTLFIHKDARWPEIAAMAFARFPGFNILSIPDNARTVTAAELTQGFTVVRNPMPKKQRKPREPRT